MSSSSSVGPRAAAVRHAQRAGGQVAALAGMVASAGQFGDVAQQLLAARGSLDSLLIRLVELELSDCLPSPAVRDEVDDLLRMALGRAAPGRMSIRSQRRRFASPLHASQHEERTGS